MNSYPIELLCQHAPLMFIAGLDLPKDTKDPFHPLVTRLRESFLSRPKGLVWDQERSTNFNILLVDKTVRFPPRKVVSTEPGAQNTPRSPLSPLISTSPLHPDGLIAPIWVRKHIELVPSVFVLFLRLWEAPPPVSPLDGREREIEQERFHDQELAQEIGVRKRAVAERSIKLTAVLLASRRMLDDPGLDARLTYIRRQSGLDSRAALFVLSPVSNAELQEFVKSLTDALRQSSADYYADHSKRVRRKRNRHTNSTYSAFQSSPVATSRASPLRSIGWTVRYEYKMGTFAEFRFEEEVARKHYEDCWTHLSEMFGSIAVLPPRTKRWAEAKVLADCVSVKIYKLYLYNNEYSLAMAHFRRHIRRFSDLSNGWGIDKNTYEYWSWLARQYRILAEVLELGLRAGLTLPTYEASVVLPPAFTSLPAEPPPIPGRNTSNVLQHPGFYYYEAALCSRERFRRFTAIAEQEKQRPSAVSNSAAFLNEQKVDHWSLILELFSKAYELFKKNVPSASAQSRLTFFIALQIATAYHESGKDEQAVRFFERITKTYRRERWKSLLQPGLRMWCESARRLGDVESCLMLMIEMLGLGDGENGDLSQDIMEILKTTSPPNKDTPLTVELSPVDELLHSWVQFYEPEVLIDTKTPFQITLSVPTSAHLDKLPIEALEIYFSSDTLAPIQIKHAASEQGSLQAFELGCVEADKSIAMTADLHFRENVTKVFYGTLAVSAPCELRVSKIVLVLKHAEWDIRVGFDPIANAPIKGLWLHSPNNNPRFVPLNRQSRSSLLVRPRPHDVDVQLLHAAPALVGEQYPITIQVRNNESRIFTIMGDFLLQPAENDTVNAIAIDDEQSSGLIKGIEFGTIHPGEISTKVLYLSMSGATGPRIIDISIQSQVATGEIAQGDSEILKTVTVQGLLAFSWETDVTYLHPLDNPTPWLDLSQLDAKQHRIEAAAVVSVKLKLESPWDLVVQSIRLVEKGSPRSRVRHSSCEEGAEDLGSWTTGDEYALSLQVELFGDDDDKPSEPIGSPAELEVKWKRDGTLQDQHVATTVIPLPNLQPPHFGMTVLIEPPAVAKLHVPFTLPVKLWNGNQYRTAELSFFLEPTDGFVVAGLKSATLPLLLPGTAEELVFNVIPINVGVRRLPNFKVTLRTMPQKGQEDGDAQRSTDTLGGTGTGEIVETVDMRWDERDAEGAKIYRTEADGSVRQIDGSMSLLVIP